MKKTNIAIVAGGYSSEMVVSLKSADGIYSFIDPRKYRPYIVLVTKTGWKVALPDGTETDIDKNDFSFSVKGEKTAFDFACITIHGTPGENGLLQGYFDMIGLPYSCCGVLPAALTFNKYVCNNYLKGFGIKTADSLRLRAGEAVGNDEIIRRLGLPLFVKPSDGGSSFGTTKVKTPEDIQPAIAQAFAEGEEVIVEAFMPGTEVTCGCYKLRNKEVVLPITEIVSKHEFFDYSAKYAGQVEEITPARISPALTGEIQRQTSGIYDLLGAKGIIRVDYIISPEGEIRMLEVNTTPGMTATSFIPQQVRAAGLSIEEVMSDIIENELRK
ncbi:MAG: D-alanine--D-alanine ligase [Dysgonamonadaceae bacterium]|nr:D-alanine--D-alanine ligase [Dysgonamonadaceae bacterium]